MSNIQDFRRSAQFPVGRSELTNSTSFSGADVSIIFILSSLSPAFKAAGDTMDSSQLQTITISSTASILPVRAVGRGRPLAYTKGARTFAGSMVFTVLGTDPFQRIANIDALQSSVPGDASWSIDQMAPFDIVIMCTNEMGETGLQAIFDVTLTHWGTTYSIEDMYLESTYTYVAEHVSPFISKRISKIEDLTIIDELSQQMLGGGKRDDEAATSVLNRMRQQHEETYGPSSAPFYDDLLVGNPAKTQMWTDLYNSNPGIDIGGFMKPGTISVAERFQRIFGKSPELPFFYNLT